MLHSRDCSGASADDVNPAAEWRHDMEADQEDGRPDLWHDSITGLPRPHSFLQHLERALRQSGRAPQSIAVLLLELSDFGALKARVGGACADELLRTVAERLHEEVPEPNLVTRLRGAQFAVVLRGLGTEVISEALATRLLERMSDPCPVGDHMLICAVVGALTFTDDRDESAMRLLDRSTRALARANLQSGARLETA